ncbi:MAG: prepilin-type N-terminal cleavage/methylation domain-containing protein [Candidatus Paceibacterota bacterium]|jgi:prepilin-type N-terminal cleavage/methylation domain-containing protein
MSQKKGITLIELLVAISITTIITAISVSVFSGLSNSTSLDRDANIILSYVTKARTKAIDSVDSLAHGVSFASTSVKVFAGTTLSAASVSESYTLRGAARISTVNLTNATSSFYFNKLTGNPSATGSITVTLAGESKTIVIYATGIAEIQ